MEKKILLWLQLGVLILGVCTGYVYGLINAQSALIDRVTKLCYSVLIFLCVVAYLYVFIRHITRKSTFYTDRERVYKKIFIVFMFSVIYMLTSNSIHSQFDFMPALDSPGTILSVISLVIIVIFKLPFSLLALFVLISFILTGLFTITNNIFSAESAAVYGFNLVFILIAQLLIKLRRLT